VDFHLPAPLTLGALILAIGSAPFVVLMMTSYTKLVIVFGLLRTALGLQQTPPNMVLNGLAIVLSIHIMLPVGTEIASSPTLQGREWGAQGESLNDVFAVLEAAKAPIKTFLQKHTEKRDLAFFLKSSNSLRSGQPTQPEVNPAAADDLAVLVPSFTVSELTRAFQIGFILFLVFVVVDLIVATVLLALGMSMISPTTISLPFKLLLFVMLDGWSQLIHGLVLSYV
jgi:type III secretion protein R